MILPTKTLHKKTFTIKFRKKDAILNASIIEINDIPTQFYKTIMNTKTLSNKQKETRILQFSLVSRPLPKEFSLSSMTKPPTLNDNEICFITDDSTKSSISIIVETIAIKRIGDRYAVSSLCVFIDNKDLLLNILNSKTTIVEGELIYSTINIKEVLAVIFTNIDSAYQFAIDLAADKNSTVDTVPRFFITGKKVYYNLLTSN